MNYSPLISEIPNKTKIYRDEKISENNKKHSKAKCLYCLNDVTDYINFFKCKKCNEQIHITCFLGLKNITNYDNHSRDQVCHICQISRIYPYEIVDKLFLAPTLLKSNLALNFHFKFKIDKMLKKQIKSEKKYNIHIYCLKAFKEFESNSKLEWPQKLQININDTAINNFKSSSSLNISYLIEEDNLIEIKNQNFSENFLIIIVGSIPISVEHFIKNMKIQNLSISDSKRALHNNHKDELIVSKEQVHLIDTITHKLIQTPVRGKYCNHFTCFDLIPFMRISWRKKNSLCPVCREIVYFSDLVEDSYFKFIIEEAVKNYGNDSDQYEIYVENGKIFQINIIKYLFNIFIIRGVYFLQKKIRAESKAK
jgi:cytochrome b involved in lipid metabolism